MKKRCSLFVVLFLLLISMTFVSAAMTMVNFRSDDYSTNAVVRLKDPSNDGVVFDTINIRTDAIGRADFEFETSRSQVQFLFLFVKEGEVVNEVLSDNYDTGKAIELDYREGEVAIYPEGVEPVQVMQDPVFDKQLEENIEEGSNNELTDEGRGSTLVEETEVGQEDKEGILDKTISGFAVVKDKITGVTPWFYYIFAFVLIGRLITAFVMHNREPTRDPDVQFIKTEPRSISHAEKKLEEAQEKVRKAQSDLEVAQGQEVREQRIEEMKNQLRKDKEKLERLEKDE